MSTFGKVTDGTASSASTADKTTVSLATAAADGVLVAGGARLWVTGGSAVVKLVVYVNSAGEPGALLASSDAKTITNTAETEIRFTFSGASQAAIVNGTSYWTGYAWLDPGSNSINFSRDGTTGGRRESATYLPNPFGTATIATGPIDAYLETAVGASSPIRVGATAIAALRVGSAAVVRAYRGTVLAWGVAPLTTRTAWLWPFATSSPWNMPIGDGATYEAATDVATANLLDTQFGSTLNADRWSQAIYRAASGDPVVTVSEVDSSPRTLTFQAAPGSQPAQPPISQGGDANWHQVQPDGQWMYENWRAEWTGPTTLNVGYDVRVDLFGDGRTGARAYGGSAIAGLIRKHEVANRSIPHAIALGLDNDQLKSGPIWPARLQDSNGSTSYAGQLPMGTLVAIPRTVNLSALGLNADALALATAFQRYGGYVTARASNVVVVSAEPGSDSTRVSAMRSQWGLVKAQLRVVTNSSQTNPGGPGNRLAPLAATVVG